MLTIVAIVAVAVGALLSYAASSHRLGPAVTSRNGAAPRPEESLPARAGTVSAEVTVEDLAHSVPTPAPHAVFRVVDHRGRAAGVLYWDDVVRMPHVERPARLVGDVARAPEPAEADPAAAPFDRRALADF